MYTTQNDIDKIKDTFYQKEADTLEQAMEKFKEECDYIKLPNGDYVDGSFRLSTDDVEEMECIVEEMECIVE